MNRTQILLISGIAFLFMACGKPENALTIVNSKSFAEKQITLDGTFAGRLSTDTIVSIQEPTELTKKLDELISISEKLKESESDNTWITILKSWEEVKNDPAITSNDTTAAAKVGLQKWAELNIKLLKFSGEVRFADALEKILYEVKVPVFSEKELKSLVFTHVYDQIFVNLYTNSTLTHYHTTGGTVRLIQETDFPKSNEMILKCETDDVRYLDVYIRIPSWAVHPTVNHGNVKYVAYPGEYCLISRKWNDGDLIRVVLKN